MLPPSSPSSGAQQSRVRRVDIQGTPILTMDFSHTSGSETLAMLDDYRAAVEGQPLGSVRLLTDVTGIAYDPAVSNKWKSVSMELDPYILATAVYGGEGLVGFAIRSFVELALWLELPNAKQKLKVFKTREKALEWLLQR